MTINPELVQQAHAAGEHAFCGPECDTEPTGAQQDAEAPLVHVGWWCWRGTGHGHLAMTACRSDNVPLHVPAEWADEMRAVLQRIEDGDEPAAAVQPSVGGAALRDRIRRALCEADGKGFMWDSDMLEPDECGEIADAVLAALLGPIPAGTDIATWTAIRAIQLMNEAGQAVEDHRLALSDALGLGTGAPWDAIHDRATELGLPPLDQDPVARRLGLLPAPAAECSAQHRRFDDGRLCIRAAQHNGDHIDERGFHWSDTVAVHPVGDGTFRSRTNRGALLRRLAGGAAGSSSPEHPDPEFKETAGNLNSTGGEAPNTGTEADDIPFEGARPCGHDDYHDGHEWADRPGLWCPGVGYDDERTG